MACIANYRAGDLKITIKQYNGAMFIEKLGESRNDSYRFNDVTSIFLSLDEKKGFQRQTIKK